MTMTFKNGLTITIKQLPYTSYVELEISDEYGNKYNFGGGNTNETITADELADWMIRVKDVRSLGSLKLKVYDEEYIKRFYEDMKKKYS